MVRKKTHEEFLEEVSVLTNNTFVVLEEYKNARTKIKIKHLTCGHVQSVLPSSFLNNIQKTTGCAKCSDKLKKTTESFKKEVFALVGSEYRVLGAYKNNKTKIRVIHEKCGNEYEVVPQSFLNGRRCRKCWFEKKSSLQRKTNEQFDEELYKSSNGEILRVDNYTHSSTKITVLHNINGCGYKWEVYPQSVLRGHGCPKCAGTIKKTTNAFKQEVFGLTNGEYEAIGEYDGDSNKVEILHKSCGYKYKARANNILNGTRCPKCFGNHKKTTEQFKKDVYDLVGDKYEVLGKYEDSKTKIRMKHNTCGFKYEVTPGNFLYGTRCPRCKESKGEKTISLFLEKHEVFYRSQYRISECRNKCPLPFDFAIFNSNKTLNCLIEYDGQQHYKPVDYWGGEDRLKQTQHNDQIKNQYCKDNNIKLIRIPYWDFDNIEDILNEELKDLINSEHYTEQAS